MSEALLGIMIAECKRHVEAADGLEEKLKAAMRQTVNHWMVTDEDMRLRGAVGAVLQHYGTGSEEWRRLEVSLNEMRSVSALLSGVPVDPERVLAQREGVEVVSIMKLWKEVKDEVA